MKMRQIAPVAIGIALLYFVPMSTSEVSADTVPVSTMPAATSTSSTVLPTVMPAAHSNGSNSFLTINDVPRQATDWSACQYDAQTYCYEPLSVIDSNGVESLVNGSTRPLSNCHGLNSTQLDYGPNAVNPSCDLTGGDWMEVQLRGTFTRSDLVNTYHWKLRTGKIEPDVLMLGDTQKTAISGNSTTGWTIEIWAKPAIKAYLEGCYSASVCSETSVATRFEVALAGYLKMLTVNQTGPTYSSVSSAELRDALRGTFISTNGMSQSWKFSTDTFFVTAVSPHFLPPDSSGKSEITPGFVRVFLPASYVMFDRGYKSLSLVTPERVKLTVSGANATAKVTSMENGILVDTGVTHFSSPNPEMMVLKASEAPLVLPSTNVAPAPVVIQLPKLKKSASKTLSSIAKTKASQKPKWTASGACKISGAKLVTLKKSGTCKVTVKVLNTKKKYVVLKTVSYKVS